MTSQQMIVRAWESPHAGFCIEGNIRTLPEDFVVQELVALEPSGEGEFDFLTVQKTSRNTDDVARTLARFAHVAYSAVSYAGLKDRHAVTTQHFTVHLPGKSSPDWSALGSPDVVVKQVCRHARKLRRGALTGNRFRLRVRAVTGDRDELTVRLARLSELGVANYFGPQRFGRGGGNLEQAQRLLLGELSPKRHLRSILLSAARAFLFNECLAQRVVEKTWDKALPGDFMMLDGTETLFGPVSETDALADRLNELDIHPTGPMPGLQGRDPAQCLTAMEQACLRPYSDWVDALGGLGVKQSRRPLRTTVRGLTCEWVDAPDSKQIHLDLSFELDAGCYATTVLEQLGLLVRPRA